MARYKNSVADIELPNIKTWNSVSSLKDDQEVLIDTRLSMASGSKNDLKNDFKKSRTPSLRISDSAGLADQELTEADEDQSLSCQVSKKI